MSFFAWCAIAYSVFILPALVVFFTVFVAERNSLDPPPYVRAAWASLAVPWSGWILYPVLILGAILAQAGESGFARMRRSRVSKKS